MNRRIETFQNSFDGATLEGLHNGGLIQISSRSFFIVSRLTHPKSAPGALHLQVISFNCYSTFFNPPSRYYHHRTAIPSTILCTMSSIANTYRALVTLCTNRQVTRLLKTVSTTHITRVERTLSPYQQDRFQTRPQVIGLSRSMSAETKACLHTTNPTQRGKCLPFLKTPSREMTAVSQGSNPPKHDTVTLLTRCRHRDPRMRVRSQESPSQAS
jgi:hypothetical protein